MNLPLSFTLNCFVFLHALWYSLLCNTLSLVLPHALGCAGIPVVCSQLCFSLGTGSDLTFMWTRFQVSAPGSYSPCEIWVFSSFLGTWYSPFLLFRMAMYFVTFHPVFIAFSVVLARGLMIGLLSQSAYYLAFLTEKELSWDTIFLYCKTKSKSFSCKEMGEIKYSLYFSWKPLYLNKC